MFRIAGCNDNRIGEIMERNHHSLTSFPNVVGVGISRKVVDSRYTDQIAVWVYVTKNVPPRCAKNEWRIP